MHTNITIKKLPASEVMITGEIPFDALLPYKKEALKRIGQSVTIPGFRTGHIPENVLIKRVGEMAVLEEMAEGALSKAYPAILAEHKLFPLSRPNVNFTKLVEGSPLGFTILVAVMPEIVLLDFKKIASAENKKPEEKIEATEKDIEELITTVRKSHVDHSKHDHNVSKEEHDKLLEQEMPEVTDEFVQKIGDFKNVADFKEKIKDNVIKEKEYKAKEKKRLQIVDAIIEKTEIEVPNVLVENELNKMTEQFKADIGRMGATLEDYLKHIKKTESDIRGDWTKDATKRVKLQLIMGKIAAEEKIEPKKEDVDKEVSHITEHYKDADPERARDYAETILRNEKVFEFLENQK